jgi:phosphinothricin acetyltransferase
MPIREAMGVDLAAIDDIYNHYVHTSTATFQIEPTTPAERRAWFDEHGPSHPVIVFEEEQSEPPGPRVAGGRIVGWASLNRYRSKAGYARTVEHSIYVRHDRHRRGIGRALLDEIVARACDAGHHVLLGMVAGDQPASLALHRRCGFRDIGRLHEVGFKFGRWLDVVLLDRLLPGAPRRELT